MAIAPVLYEERTLGSRGGMVSVTWCWCGLRRLKEEMVGRHGGWCHSFERPWHGACPTLDADRIHPESLLTSSRKFDQHSPTTALVSYRRSGIFYYSAPKSSTFPPRVFTISSRLLRPSETTATCDQFQQSLSIELFCLPTPTQLSPQRRHTTHSWLPVAFANTLLT